MKITFSNDRFWLTREPPPHVPCFALDKDVLEALFHTVNELRFLKVRSKKKQNRMRSRYLHAFPFDAVEKIQVMSFQYPERFVYSIMMTFPGDLPHQVNLWDCRVYSHNLTPGGNPFHDHNGCPLMPSPARIKWNALQRRMRGLARALVVFGRLLEEVQLRPGGTGYRRVKARFDMMTAAPSV